MTDFTFKPTASRNLLLAIVLTLAVLAAVLFRFREPILEIYFRQHITVTAVALNGMVIALFFAGMLRLTLLLWRYRKEELAIAGFMKFLAHHKPGQSPQIDPSSLIARRYVSMARARREGTTPNHAALAQILLAEESSRGNSPRFVHNILILAGVFGTMVSLSIALFGTSSLLQTSGGDTQGINLVVDGMSTALSTTMTAIVCYVIFGFFFSRTMIQRTRILSTIESITTDYLMPRFRIKTDNIAEEMATVIDSLQQVVRNMLVAQNDQKASEDLMRQAILTHDENMEELTQQVEDLRKIMLRGFRLADSRRPQ